MAAPVSESIALSQRKAAIIVQSRIIQIRIDVEKSSYHYLSQGETWLFRKWLSSAKYRTALAHSLPATAR